MKKKWLLLPLISLVLSCAGELEEKKKVLPGIDVLLQQKIDLIKDKRVGLITNPTGVTRALVTTVDAMAAHPDIELAALFGPEHGVRGDFEAGSKVKNSVDKKTGVPVYSLYGPVRKPTAEMLENIDILVYDIQDIGCRSYTYIYTMAFAMQAAKAHGIPFMVLDRPNPLGGNLVEGPMLDTDFRSFIGYYPISYIYGMTAGELAEYFNREFDIHADLTVVHMQGWKRSMHFDETGLTWIPTSPHLPRAITAFYYPATGIMGELDTFNIGVGYTTPFEMVGAPWIDGGILAQEMNLRSCPGVVFRPVHYQPYYSRFAGQKLAGIHLHIFESKEFKPVATQVHLLTAMRKCFPKQRFFDTRRTSSFDKAAGSDQLRKMVESGADAEAIIASWQSELQAFLTVREKYLFYTD